MQWDCGDVRCIPPCHRVAVTSPPLGKGAKRLPLEGKLSAQPTDEVARFAQANPLIHRLRGPPSPVGGRLAGGRLPPLQKVCHSERAAGCRPYKRCVILSRRQVAARSESLRGSVVFRRSFACALAREAEMHNI